MNQNRGGFYFIGLMIAVLGFVIMDYTLHKEAIVKTLQLKNKSVIAKKTALVDTGQSIVAFKKSFQAEVLKMSQLQDDPDEAEIRAHSLAKNLKPEHLQFLNELVNNSQKNKDDRSFAIELLSLSQEFQAHQILNNFAQNENFGLAAKTDFELALRAQAIEGMANYQDKKLVQRNLENLKIRTRYSFLNERAARALNYVSGHVPSIDQPGDAEAARVGK